MIYEAREPSTAMFVIITGYVMLESPSNDDLFQRYIHIQKDKKRVLQPGDSFGAEELLHGDRRRHRASVFDAHHRESGEPQIGVRLLKISLPLYNRWIKPFQADLVLEAGTTWELLQSPMEKRAKQTGQLQRLLHNMGYFRHMPAFLLRQLVMFMHLGRPSPHAMIVHETGSQSFLLTIISGQVAVHAKNKPIKGLLPHKS